MEETVTDIRYDDRTRAPAERTAAGPTTDGAVGTAGTTFGDATADPAARHNTGSAVSTTAGTAKEQIGQVAGEVKSQAGNLASQVKGRVGTEARGQNDRLAQGLRNFADELDQMVDQRGDSPARSVVAQVSNRGRKAADYLAEHGPEGVLHEVQDFARRRPGTFLAIAAAVGFVAGRVGKSVFNSTSPGDTASRSTGPVPLTDPYEAPVGTPTTYVGSTANDLRS
jgi:hypothetical protein